MIRKLNKFVSGLVVVMMLSNSAFAATFDLDDNGDAGDDDAGDGSCATSGAVCTLRAALEEANALAGDHTITTSGNFTYTPSTALPTITRDNLFLDLNNGSTVDVDGGGSLTYGLDVNADNVTIHGINVRGFEDSGSGAGINIRSGADGTTLQGVVSGLDTSNNVDANDNGVIIDGTDTTITASTLSGNNNAGVRVTDNAADVTISGNLIGIDFESNDRGNTAHGVQIYTNSTQNLNGDEGVGVLIGGDEDGEGNFISGNGGNGVFVEEGASGALSGDLKIQGNYIGLAYDESTARGNDQYPIKVGESGDPTNVTLLIGSDGDGTNDSTEANYIANNNAGDGDDAAVYVYNTGSSNISGNVIGFEGDGNTAADQDGDGIFVDESGVVTVNDNVIGNAAGHGINVQGATSLTAQGNSIGIGADGSTDADVTGTGILINASDAATVVIGGADASERNTIAHSNKGIDISDTAVSADIDITNNCIGFEGDCATAGAVTAEGVGVADGNTVDVVQNVIGNIGANALSITGGVTLTITGNKIGTTTTGLVAAANSGIGVLINSATATSVTIGGATSALGNVIAAGTYGVRITALASSAATAVLQGNYIGVGGDGKTTTSMGNSSGGVLINAGRVTIGGDNSLGADGTGDLGEGNVISNNSSLGVSIGDGNDHFSAYGNLIGVIRNASDVFATAAANTGGGVTLSNNSTSVFNFGSSSGTSSISRRNVVSGNTGNGLSVSSTAAALTASIANNYIGADWLGATDVGNSSSGLSFGTISGTFAATIQNNLVSGNGGKGMDIAAGTYTILGNKIGLNAAGDSALGNDDAGIRTANASTVAYIGNGTESGRNVISGNASAGVEVSSATTVKVQGNYIGTNADGDAKIGNGSSNFGGLINFGGVYITNSTADSTTIGTDEDGTNDSNEGNVISGNFGQGVMVNGATGVKIAGNIIGLAADGATALGNVAGDGNYEFFTDGGSLMNGSGLLLIDAVGGAIDGAKIGGASADAANVISSNAAGGIVVTHGTSGVLGNGQDWDGGYIKGNKIGVADDGTTIRGNGSYPLYVNPNTGTFSNFSVGSAADPNIINNTSTIGMLFADLLQSSFTENVDFITTNNTWTDEGNCPTYQYWERYVDSSLTNSVPTCDEESSSSSSGGGVVPIGSGGSGGSSFSVEAPEGSFDVPGGNSGSGSSGGGSSDGSSSSGADSGSSSDSGAGSGSSEESGSGSESAEDEVVEEVSVEQVEEERGTLEEAVDSVRGSSRSVVNINDGLSVSENLVREEIRAQNNANNVDKVVSEEVESEVLSKVNLQNVLRGSGGEVEVVEEQLNAVFSQPSVKFVVNKAQAAEAAQTSPGVVVVAPDTVNDAGVSYLFAVSEGIDISEEDTNDNGVEDVKEIFWHSHPKNKIDVQKTIEAGPVWANRETFQGSAFVFPSKPSIRFMAEDGEVDVRIVGADGREIEVGEVLVEENMGEYGVKSSLKDGRYYLVANGGDKRSMFEFDVEGGKVRDVEDLNVEDLVLKGKAEPGSVVMIAWKSVILSSVVIADANGEFEIGVPRNLPGGEHEVVAYSYLEDVEASRAVMSNSSRLIFRK